MLTRTDNNYKVLLVFPAPLDSTIPPDLTVTVLTDDHMEDHTGLLIIITEDTLAIIVGRTAIAVSIILVLRGPRPTKARQCTATALLRTTSFLRLLHHPILHIITLPHLPI